MVVGSTSPKGGDWQSLPQNDERNTPPTRTQSVSTVTEPNSEKPPPKEPSKSPAEKPSGATDELEYPRFRIVLVLMACLFLVTFLIALDRLIIATAIPHITDQFNSLGDVGWYVSAYLLTSCSFQLLMGRIYTFYNPKWVWLGCILIFEIGSAICGAAPNSPVFIFGRALAGLGTSGILSGTMVIIVYAVPLYKRPMYVGLFGAVFGLASVAGPLLGGVFTDKVSWRWCFYINLPLGSVAAAVITFFVHLPVKKNEKSSIRQQLAQLDLLGTAVFLPSTVCLLLALQWGGTIYAWSNWRIILLLVLFGVTMPVFIYIQHVKQETATVPPRIFKYRSIMAAMWWSFTIPSAMTVIIYYLPLWFQAVKGVSAIKSGIMMLPLVIGMVIAIMIAGFLTRKIGYYTHWLYFTAVLLPIAAGLITTYTPTTNHPKWIGTQVFFGVALGVGFQQGNLACQTVLPRKDVPTGLALAFFCNALGSAIFVSVGNNIFDNELARNLRGIAGLDPAKIVKTGATNLRNVVRPDLLPRVLEGYNRALVACFYVATALSCAAIFGALAMEWRSIKGRDAPGEKKAGQDGKVEEGTTQVFDVVKRDSQALGDNANEKDLQGMPLDPSAKEAV